MIDENQLDQIESLLFQSMKGCHLLFDHQQIAEVLQKPTKEADFFRQDNIDLVQKLFTELVEKKGHSPKAALLAGSTGRPLRNIAENLLSYCRKHSFQIPRIKALIQKRFDRRPQNFKKSSCADFFKTNH